MLTRPDLYEFTRGLGRQAIGIQDFKGYRKAWVRMIGQFATSKAGRDKGCLYVIVAEEEDFVWLCDGKQKKPETPKKKRRKHIQPINAWVEESLLERLKDGKKVYAEEIRYALKKYSERSAKDAPFIRSEVHASDKRY